MLANEPAVSGALFIRRGFGGDDGGVFLVLRLPPNGSSLSCLAHGVEFGLVRARGLGYTFGDAEFSKSLIGYAGAIVTGGI